ncbi:MAG: autotransporter outer membrane beta-barrel domain-containing protein [Pseudobdellovibrio sp.]
MKQLLAFLVLGLSFNVFAADTVATNQPEQVVLFDRTNGAKPDAEVKPKAETVAAPKAKIIAKKKKAAASTPAATPLQNVIEKDTQKDLSVDGKSRFNNAGEAVVIVPVAKPGHISGVTASGEVVMIPTAAANQVATMAPVEPPVAAPAPAPVAETAAVNPADDSKIEAEVNAANAAGENTTTITNQKTAKSKMYVAGVLGVGSYPEVSNVNEGYALSLAAGYNFDERISAEAGITLGQYKMDVKNQFIINRRDDYDVNQYGAFLGAKIELDQLFDIQLTPNVGALVAYSYRQYSLTNYNTGSNSNTTGSSNAWDAGLSAGLDYVLDAGYAIGADLKYMFNISNSVNSTYINPTYGYTGSKLENLQYYTLGLSAKVNF